MKILSLLVFTGIFLTSCSSARPAREALNGKLPPCPSSPNCVSSQSDDREHATDPLRFSGTAAKAMADLKKVLAGMKRTKILTETGTYLHAECTSFLFRFVDDLEFLVIEQDQIIHVRSASRVGHSDLGVNRKRVEAVRAAWERLQRAKENDRTR